MRSHLRPLTLLLLATLLAGVTASAWGQRPQERGPQRDDRANRGQRDFDQRGLEQRDQRDLSDSVRHVERTTRGQVLSAERIQYDGRDVSRVKVMDDRGRVRVYLDDPQSRQDREPRRTRDDDGGDPNL